MSNHITAPLIFSILLLILPQFRSEKILIFHHVASYSHRVVTWPVAEALSARGHDVTYIAPYHPKEPNPNITELIPIKLENYVEEFLNQEFEINLRVENRMNRIIDEAFTFGQDACEALYTSEEFKDWLTHNKKMDLVIVDNCLPECGVALAHKLGAKYAIFSTVATIGYEYDAFGYVPESSAIPELEIDPPMPPFGFLTRVSNALMSLSFRARHYLYSLHIDNFIRNSLEFPDMPYVGDLISNVSLVFYTGDVFSDFPRALPPNFVNVAGTHCRESTKNLPQEINDFIMNGTSASFVYLSLGSLVVSSNLPDHLKQVFFKTIESFPNLKFLWKWNGDFPKNIPDNLYLGKWFPQADILGHPKIRAFITQSGRPSTLEAIFNGVPLISFPILGDQDYNAYRLHQIGAATKLEIGSVTVKEFQDAIRKTVYDPRVQEKMTKIQTLFRDRPMSPVDTAVWWSEYVMRNDDISHLRPAGHSQNWFIRRQIDVWAFLSISIFLIVVSFLVILTKVVRHFLNMNTKLKQM